jgi:hypothetical protein
VTLQFPVYFYVLGMNDAFPVLEMFFSSLVLQHYRLEMAALMTVGIMWNTN